MALAGRVGRGAARRLGEGRVCVPLGRPAAGQRGGEDPAWCALALAAALTEFDRLSPRLTGFGSLTPSHPGAELAPRPRSIPSPRPRAHSAAPAGGPLDEPSPLPRSGWRSRASAASPRSLGPAARSTPCRRARRAGLALGSRRAPSLGAGRSCNGPLLAQESDRLNKPAPPAGHRSRFRRAWRSQCAVGARIKQSPPPPPPGPGPTHPPSHTPTVKPALTHRDLPGGSRAGNQHHGVEALGADVPGGDSRWVAASSNCLLCGSGSYELTAHASQQDSVCLFDAARASPSGGPVGHQRTPAQARVLTLPLTCRTHHAS